MAATAVAGDFGTFLRRRRTDAFEVSGMTTPQTQWAYAFRIKRGPAEHDVLGTFGFNSPLTEADAAGLRTFADPDGGTLEWTECAGPASD